MKKLTMVVCVCLLFAATLLGAQFTGYISDSHCGAKHMDGSQASTNCVTSCIKGGAAPVFVAMDKKVYKLTDKSKVTSFYGKKVKITGSMSGDTVTIENIEAAK